MAAVFVLVALGVTVAPSAHAQKSGIVKGYMDTSCAPCKDFYRYAIGAWQDTANIPAAYTGVGAGREMVDRNQETLYAVLEGVRANAATATDPTLKKLGYLYATTLDSVRADKDGWQPIAADLAAIDAIQSKADLRKYFATCNVQGRSLPFNFGAEADPAQSSVNIGQIRQGGLGLPDRDYYFKTDPKSEALRQDYVAHLARLFQLVGAPEAQAQADAGKVMKLETALAESCMTLVAQRDPKALYHKITVKELQALSPAFDWSAYFTEVGVPALAKPDAKLDVSMPNFVKGMNTLFDTTPLDDWKVYLKAHLLHGAAPWLSQSFFDESFAFGSKLSGAKAPLPRWKRCAAAADDAMGEALGKAYVEKVFPASSKAKMMEMVNNLLATLRERIQTREWMSPETKKAAMKKLDATLKKIGYPDTWRDYSALTIDADAPGIVNLLHAQAFEAARERAKIGKPVDRGEWLMTAPTVNAYSNPPNNEIVFPAGILTPPQFDPNAPDAVNYGAIGVVIGHEITHGFDDEGRQYDEVGNLKDWWTDSDGKNFTARAQRVVDQYNGYVAVDTLHVNGSLTLWDPLESTCRHASLSIL